MTCIDLHRLQRGKFRYLGTHTEDNNSCTIKFTPEARLQGLVHLSGNLELQEKNAIMVHVLTRPKEKTSESKRR